MQEHFAEIYPESEAKIDECLYLTQKYVVRRWLLDEQKRVDGRGMDDMRPLAAEVALLPRVHGSGMFTRGQTQVLTVATLGSMRDNQLLDGIDEEENKRYIHHYRLPLLLRRRDQAQPGPWPPGDRPRRFGGAGPAACHPLCGRVPLHPAPGQRGAFFQRLHLSGFHLRLYPGPDGTPAWPIKAPVAGISCGLITEGDRWMTMVDIQGIEDFFGDMDFKVGGTKKGITAIQMGPERSPA